MVNAEKFTKRLQKILDHHDISAATFADKINVGRSSISHILSGRNKPSLDFVTKVTATFPDVELEWLLFGRGNFPKVAQENLTSPSPPPPIVSTKTNEKKISINSLKAKLKLKKIVFFYEDGSFEIFEN